MTAILQISDTHIVRQGALVSDRLDSASALARLVARIGEVRDQIGAVDALLVTGDLSDDGTADSYARFKSLIAPLTLPVLAVPGNHDVRAHMRVAFADHLPRLGPLNWSRTLGRVRLIGLDTLVEGKGDGALAPESLTFLDTALQQADGAPVLLALHHPPFDCGIRFMDRIGLRDKAALLARLARYAGPLRIVCGHIHSLMIRDLAGHVAISAPSPVSSFAYDRRAHAPVGYLAQEDGCLLHRWEEGFQTIRISPAPGSGPFPF